MDGWKREILGLDVRHARASFVCVCVCAPCGKGQRFLSFWGQAVRDAHIWTNADLNALLVNHIVFCKALRVFFATVHVGIFHCTSKDKREETNARMV